MEHRAEGWYWVMDDGLHPYPCYWDGRIWELRQDFNVNDTFFRKIFEEKLQPPQP